MAVTDAELLLLQRRLAFLRRSLRAAEMRMEGLDEHADIAPHICTARRSLHDTLESVDFAWAIVHAERVRRKVTGEADARGDTRGPGESGAVGAGEVRLQRGQTLFVLFDDPHSDMVREAWLRCEDIDWLMGEAAHGRPTRPLGDGMVVGVALTDETLAYIRRLEAALQQARQDVEEWKNLTEIAENRLGRALAALEAADRLAEAGKRLYVDLLRECGQSFPAAAAPAEREWGHALIAYEATRGRVDGDAQGA